MKNPARISIRQPLSITRLKLSLESERRWLDCGLEIADLYMLLTLGRRLIVTGGTWYCFDEQHVPPGAEDQLRHLVGFSVLIMDGQIREIGRTLSLNPELP